jgi:ureidoglycolate hydrolase
MDGGAGSNLYLEVLENREQSFKPLTAFNGWRVAVLNYFDMVAPKNLKKAERHMETDEVFVLLSGSACLLTGSDGAAPNQLTVTAMEPQKVYNVRQMVWHHVLLSPNAAVLIVENEDTAEENSEYKPISAEELALLRGAVKYCLDTAGGSNSVGRRNQNRGSV